MSGSESELVSLLLSEGEDKLKAKLKDLEGNHNLELLLSALMKISKKSMLGAELKPCVVPFVKKHFGSLPTTKVTSLVDELIKFSSKEYSIRTSVPLLKLLIETAQLGNAIQLRRLIKTNVVALHDRLRHDGFDSEADLILGCISNVFLLELNLLDNVNPQEIETVWKKLEKSKEKADVYLFASILLYTALNNPTEVSNFENEFCKNFKPDQSFVDYCLPYIHVALPAFSADNVVFFLRQILKFYIEQRKLDELYEAIFKVPELRNNQLPKFADSLVSSTLMVLWERIANQKKRKSGDSGELASGVKSLLETINEMVAEYQFSVDAFKFLFSQCCKTFSKFVYNKEMKATAFVDCLLVIQDLIPSFDSNKKCLLVAVMPFVTTCTGEEFKLIQILKLYSGLLNDLPPEYLSAISTECNSIGDFLDVLIRRCSRDSNELRYQCAKVVAIYLHDDWTFIKGFVKGKKLESFEALTSTFNKAIRAQKRIPRSEIVTVYRTCLFIYEKESEKIKSKEFKPLKGLGLLVDSLTDFLKSNIQAPADLSAHGPVIGGIIVDLVSIFIQLVRLCKIAGMEVENVKVITPVLKQLFDEENGFSLIQESERSFVLNSLVENMVNYRIHLDLDGFFTDVRRLVNLAKSPQCGDQLLLKIVKPILLKQTDIDWKLNLKKYFPIEKTLENDEIKNVIFKLLKMVIIGGKGNVLEGLENYIFSLLMDSETASTDYMDFGAVFLNSIEKKKDFGDFLSVVLLSCVNSLASQCLTKQYEVIIAEIRKSTAAVTVIEALTKMPSRVIASQIHVVGQIVAKLIFNLTIFRQFVQDSRENPKRRHEVKLVFDNYLKRLSIICKAISGDPRLVKQLPLIISNCLTGEREPNLPTYHLLAGCDEEGLSFLATNLPSEQKRRFAITFPNFIAKNKFTG